MSEKSERELEYIKYSAKEILFHLTSKVEKAQEDISNIRQNMVTRDELAAARRWAIGATISATTAIIGVIRVLST